MKKNKQQVIHHNQGSFDSYPKSSQQDRQMYGQGQPVMQKKSGLNQSMDAGMSNYASANVIGGLHDSNQKIFISNDSQGKHINSSFDVSQQDPKHFRSGSHQVTGVKNAKKSSLQQRQNELFHQQNLLVQASSYGQGELSQSQILAIQQQNSLDNQRKLMSRGSNGQGNGDRIQQQKAKRKQNASKNFEYQGSIQHMSQPTNNTIGAPNQPSQVTINSKLQQNNFSIQQELSSKRSYENTNFEMKAQRSKQKFINMNPNQNQYIQTGNLYETARYNSINSLNHQNNVINNSNILINHQTSSSKERYQGTQKLIKKSHKISGQGGSIILPASSGIQGAPQLKSQLSKNGGQKFYQQPLNSTIQSQQHFITQAHQRGGSVQNSDSLGMSMQRGFNSASNAAIQQQAQIVQIYQQNPGSASNNGSNSMNKIKNYANQGGNNSRKVIPILQQNQINQVVSHHKRAQQNVQQLSRDQTGKQLIDSYPNQNYQTFSQNYAQSQSQLQQNVPVRKSNDTSRATRLASRDQKRPIQNDQQFMINDHNSNYNTQSNVIPQKKQGTRFNKQPNSSSIPNLSNQSSFNQTSSHGFFQEGASNTQNIQQMQDLLPNSHHQKNPSQYTPQLTQSMKHTIQNNQPHQNSDGMILQPKKSQGQMMAQSHIRQTSVQVAEQKQKMTAQHRKNKSVLNNQMRINPSFNNQNQQSNVSSTKIRMSQDKIRRDQGQYYDNYTDQMQSNYYMQQLQQSTASGSKLNMTQGTPHQITNSNLTSAQLKHNLTQSSHRKNKTTVMGGNGQQKILGINSSSAFQQMAPTNLIAGSNSSQSAMKKIIGGTISHSHKSLRSQSSSRKRVSSVDSNLALGQNQSTNMSSNSKKMKHVPSGHMTPDMSSYANGNSKHSQKASNHFKNQTGNMRQQLKPHGKILIQQQPPSTHQNNEMMSQHQSNLKSSQGNRRHSSILKGEHQNKQMIMIDQNGVSVQKNRIPQNPNQRRKVGQIPELGGEDQESMISTQSMRASNMVFQDGSTGGVNPNGKARKLSSQGRQEKLQPSEKYSNAFNTDKKRPVGQRLADSSDDYNSNDFQVRAVQNMGMIMQRPQMLDTDNDIDDADLDIEILPDNNKMVPDYNKNSSSQQKHNKGRHHEILELDVVEQEFSKSISKEALAMGKIPPEKVAELIARSGYKLQHTDKNLSPRTREMVDITNKIRKSFIQFGEAPKTTPDYYRAGKMLGRGAFGKVSMGMHKLSRKLVALKSINKEFMSNEKQKSKIMHEVGILLRLRHKNVVKLYETFETKRHMLLSMELCAGGDLLNYVRKRKKLDEDVSRVVFRQIIEGLGYIHKKRILHRDIKLDNILLDGNGNVKIADFGVSKLVKKPGEVMTEQSGTPAYIAPEILKEEGYTGFKADIWSAGVVFYAMLCGTVPFKAGCMKELHKMIIKGKYNLKEEVSDSAKHLLRQMLETDPKKRISISKILEHPWMQFPENPPEIFNQEEKDVVKKEFIYNNPKAPIRSEKVNYDEEPWDAFTELDLDSIDQALRNESEKSVILAPFNSSISDFDEEEYKGMEASLIIHRLFNDEAPLQDKKATVRFAARCRDQDRQYEINNNGELDNGVYHKFVYSSRDGQPEASSSLDDPKGSINDLRPHSSRNMSKPSGGIEFGEELEKLKKGMRDDEFSQSKGDPSDTDSVHGIGVPGVGEMLDPARVQTLINFGYPDDYVRYCLLENEASYCLSGYFLLGENQQY